ncbi:MAG: gliding motility protein GldN [Muribaculaceae bacterium]|nr:gliding motility protein GldN [Muribaculaceae bacterium]MDE6314995.1 gliding motility protein GldN [Muribaculaceae bacterium]
MKRIAKHILIVLTAICAATTAQAQESQSSGVSRGSRTRPGRTETQQSAAPGVSARMQQHLGASSEASDADTRWMRVIYRELDLEKEDKNAPLYFPEEIIDGNENLFRIIMRLYAANQIPVYEYLDGREIFTDQYRAKVDETLRRFEINFTPSKNFSDKNPVVEIDEYDVPASQVLTYYIIERWRFDNRTNSMRTTVEAICPVLHRLNAFGASEKTPIGWIRMDDLRPYLKAQYVFTDDDNNLPRYTYDDFFTLGLYKGDIYKTRNLRNRTMAQLYSDPDDLKRAQDSIQNRLDHYADNLWVPTREEIAAARLRADSIAAAADTLNVVAPAAERPARAKSSSRTSSRSKARTSKVKKEPKAKEAKPARSSATRSVRNRRK